jgi:hypothetical protein
MGLWVDYPFENLNDEASKNFAKHFSRRSIPICSASLSANQTADGMLQRSGPGGRRAIYEKYLGQYEGADPILLEVAQHESLRDANAGHGDWDRACDLLRRAPYSFSLDGYPRAGLRRMPLAIGRRILGHAIEYPPRLIREADRLLQKRSARRLRPVANDAARDQWFAD